MNKLLTTLFSLAVAAVTATSYAQEVKGDAKAGEKKIAMCIGCHGIKGYQASFPEVYRVPMISGQGAKYITAALNAYRGGERKHGTMRAIASSMSDQDIADVSAFYEAHGKGAAPAGAPAAPPTARVDALLKKGGCVACHGDNFSKPIDPSYPKVGGQHADYVFVALKSYKTEGNTQVGRSNGIMAGIAKQFSNTELKELSSYLATLPGDLRVVPESRFR
ncbi:MAG: cytochrome c4 [Burkholderiaceae bacterium]|nr:cytochrome c4 [Burkholderiaceae bacterium]MDO9088846.1 cytochrome c4 [Burkholderiaceae bacterium]